MDSDDNASMEPTRASPRSAGIKTGKKKLVEDVDHVSFLGDRVNKKRRTGNTKPTKLGCSRQNVGFKCSPHLMHHLFQSLNEDQRIWVQEIGFGDLLSMPSSVLPKGLTVWLVNQVCWKERSLVLGGRSIQIKNVVKKILGIPDGLHPVPLPRCRRGKAKGSKVAVPERETKGGKSGRGVSYKTTYESLIATKDPVQFKRAFMLYVLCIYFAPSSGLFINKNYAAIINDVDLIKDMNWCHHVADVLIEGAREYRESKALNVNVHGCVHVLLLIYIDIVKSAFIKVPEGTPRAIYVNSVNLEMLDYHDLKFTTHEGAEYGKLEIDHQHDYFTSHGGCIPPKLPAMNKTKPGCSQAAYTEEDGKVVNDSIMKIETDFLVARDKAYEECFRALGKRMDIIDTIRSAAISQVLGKWFRGFPLANPPSVRGTTAVFSQSATTGVKEKRSSVVKPVDCMLSTPQKQNSNSKTVLSRSSISAEKCEGIYGNNFSGEFSFKMKRSSRGQPNEYIISEVGTSTSSPCTPVVGPYACPTSAEFRPQSVDLQQNCRQFSTFLVISQEQRKFPRPPQQINRPSLVGVQHTTPVEATVPFDYDDPLGFDTMDNVAAWAKECEGQAIEDALKDGICSTYLSENMKDSEQAPFPCLGKEVISERYGPSVNPGHDKIMECKNAVFQQEGSFDQAAPDPSTDLVCTKLSSDHTSPNSDAIVVIQKEYLKPVQLPCVAASSEDPPLFRKQGKEKQPSILDQDSIRSAVNSITTHLTPQSRQFHIHVPQESMYIPPSPEHCSRYDVENVARVEAPIAGGEFFTDVGSVNLAVRSRAKRFGRSEEMIDAIADLNKSACKLKPAASATYADYVENSLFWSTQRKDAIDPARNCGGKTIIRIRGVHLTEEEYVHTLRPDGEVDHNFMWICSLALMLDWASITRTILKLSIITDLMKPHDSCDHKRIASTLKKLRLDTIDQFYLPVRNKVHWVLIIISMSAELFEIYDTLRPEKRLQNSGDNHYTDLWNTIGQNFQRAYYEATSKEIPINEKFRKKDAQIQAQTLSMNNSGMEVIRLLACHNGKDLICYGKKNIVSFRKELSHTLLFNRFNDLHPENLQSSK